MSIPAFAQSAPADKDKGAQQEEARTRFQRGLQLFSESNYDAARVEFERAYQLAPSYKVLYNIGLCYEQQGDYVQAQATLGRYLQLGGAEINEERRNEVAKELAQIRPRIAKIIAKTNIAGADLLVDDACPTEANSGNVNCSALAGTTRTILVNPGRRRLSVKKPGYFPQTQLVTVAGSDQTEVVITLQELPKAGAEKKTNPWLLPTYVGWGVTAAALITSGVTGVLTLSAKDDQLAAVDKFGSTRAQLDEAKDKTETLATVTDAFLIGAGVAAVVSVFFTVKAMGWKGNAAEKSTTATSTVRATPFGVAGTF